MKTLNRLNFILEEVEKYSKYLEESIISPNIKKEINSIINKKKSDSFKVGSMNVNVTVNNKEITFSYAGKESDELTYTLIDIADARGLETAGYKKSGKEQNFKMIM